MSQTTTTLTAAPLVLHALAWADSSVLLSCAAPVPVLPWPTFTPRTLPLARGCPIGQRPGECRCPHCRAVIYTRRHKLCGVCATELPKELLFSPAQVSQVEALVTRERQAHRAWMKRKDDR